MAVGRAPVSPHLLGQGSGPAVRAPCATVLTLLDLQEGIRFLRGCLQKTLLAFEELLLERPWAAGPPPARVGSFP